MDALRPVPAGARHYKTVEDTKVQSCVWAPPMKTSGTVDTLAAKYGHHKQETMTMLPPEVSSHVSPSSDTEQFDRLERYCALGTIANGFEQSTVDPSTTAPVACHWLAIAPRTEIRDSAASPAHRLGSGSIRGYVALDAGFEPSEITPDVWVKPSGDKHDGELLQAKNPRMGSLSIRIGEASAGEATNSQHGLEPPQPIYPL